jgi:hypothetical protein
MGCSGSKPASASADGKGDATLLTSAADAQEKNGPQVQADQGEQQAETAPLDEAKAEEAMTGEAQPGSEKPQATENTIATVEAQEDKESMADRARTQESQPTAEDSKATEVAEPLTAQLGSEEPGAKESRVDVAKADEAVAKAEDVKITEPAAEEAIAGMAQDVASMVEPKLEPKVEGTSESICCKCGLW